MKFRCDGKLFVSGHWDGTVRLYDSKKFKPLAILKYVEAHIPNFIISDEYMCVFLYVYSHHRLSVFSIAFAPNHSGMFASGSKDGTIALWNIYADKMK